MDLSFLRGTGVALVTPFNERQEIDWDAHRKIIDFVLNNGINYLVVLGTTGESVTLEHEEKADLIAATVEFAAGRAPVIAGFGGNNTNHVIKELATIPHKGVSAILSVSPSYNKPTQDGIYEHYKAVSSATDLPIVLYNVPGRTSSNIKWETTVKMAENLKNIRAIKEATYDLEQITMLTKNKPDGFFLLSGCDDLIFHEMALGFDGVISVAGNVIPKQFSDMINYCLAGDFANARKIQLDIYRFIFMLFEQGNPAGAKCAFKHLGLCEEYIRLPLVPVNDELRGRLGKELARVTRNW